MSWGADKEYICLSVLDIRPCLACYACQNVSGAYGCAQQDDMHLVVDAIRSCDCLVLATPIFSWYCTAQMKAVLDRHYGFNKFYGEAEGSLWEGKHVAVIATHGYEADYAISPFVTGIQRLCEHSALVFDGTCSVRDTDDLASFQTEEAVAGARAFACRPSGGSAAQGGVTPAASQLSKNTQHSPFCRFTAHRGVLLFAQIKKPSVFRTRAGTTNAAPACEHGKGRYMMKRELASNYLLLLWKIQYQC